MPGLVVVLVKKIVTLKTIIDCHLPISQRSIIAAKMAKAILGCLDRKIVSRPLDVLAPVYSVLVRPWQTGSRPIPSYHPSEEIG